MKRKWSLLGAAVGTSLAVVLTGCSGTATGGSGSGDATLADMDPIVLRVATLSGQDNYNTTPQIAFAERIEERTDGKVSFEFFYAGSLVPTAELPASLGQGVYDFGYFLPSVDPAAFPVDTWASKLAFAHESTPPVGELQAATAGLDWASSFDAYTQQFLDANIVPILPQVHITSAYALLCKEDNSTLESVAGKRVRVGGETWANEAENLGMVPVTIPYTEVYQSFQQGVIDCFMGSPRDVYAMGLTDHAQYLNFAGLTGWSSATVGFNRDVWNGLPQEVKDIVWEEAPQLFTDLIQGGLDIDVEFAEKAADLDITFVTPDADMAKRIAAGHDKQRETAIANAPALIDDPAAVAQSHTEIHAKWLETLVTDLKVSDEYASWADFVEAGAKLPDLVPVQELLNTEVFTEYSAR